MGYILKACVYSVSLCILSVNLYYFSNVYGDLLYGKGGRYELSEAESNYEPLTIRGNGGRLGNQMFVLATLYGLAKLNGRHIALMPKNFEALSPYFELNYPKVDMSRFIVRDPWKIGHWLVPSDSSIPATSNILAGNIYPTSFTFFQHVQEDIRGIFRLKETFREHAENILRHVKYIRPRTQVFVCVHVRRGDYLRKTNGGWLRAAEGREVDVLYFQKSIDYFRSKYQNVTFLTVSDDRRWTREKLSPLGILTLPEVEDPGYDLAVLSSCNHTIMSYGSFGFWGGFLAGGEVVYFSDFIRPGSKMADIFVYDKMYPKHWRGISTTTEGYWENYTNAFKIK